MEVLEVKHTLNTDCWLVRDQKPNARGAGVSARVWEVRRQDGALGRMELVCFAAGYYDHEDKMRTAVRPFALRSEAEYHFYQLVKNIPSVSA